MKTELNSINHNGCSVCEQGKEKYTVFFSAHRNRKPFFQYDYKHTDGKLFSTVAYTLSECRILRDMWLKNKS